MYNLSFYCRSEAFNGSVDVFLGDNNGEKVSEVFVAQAPGSTWEKYEVQFKATATTKSGMLCFKPGSEGRIYLDMVSLFPDDTWDNGRSVFRKDIMENLVDYAPDFLRFPGGCIVEGADLPTRYNWKNSVGPVENRPLNENRWQHSFRHRYYPDYFQSYGLGFYEYFLLSEEIGAEPLPIVSCGLACQFQNFTPDAHQPVCELDEYIQDALDLIEFANGSPDTRWGRVRAEMGHPENHWQTL